MCEWVYLVLEALTPGVYMFKTALLDIGWVGYLNIAE